MNASPGDPDVSYHETRRPPDKLASKDNTLSCQPCASSIQDGSSAVSSLISTAC